MITKIKIQGGLGNQMFQYAYGRSLEISGKDIVFDVSFFDKKSKEDTARDFKLNNFNIETNAKFSNEKYLFIDITNKIKRRLGLKAEEYFQNEKYFKNVENVIRKEFTLKKELESGDFLMEKNKIDKFRSVSIHVRRGDYINDEKTKNFHGVCSKAYYEKAMEIIKTKVDSPLFYFFSDDMDWVKKEFGEKENFYFVSNPKLQDYEELILMSCCAHNIIANSSFSWWSAWLNKNKEKSIVAPKQWFVNKNYNQLDILPKEWLKT